MSDLSRLIEINENIEKQNAEIIRLLKKIAGENQQDEIVKEVNNVLQLTLDVGEVYFVENSDIFKLTIKNNETNINNLTDVGETDNYNLAQIIANQSISKNQSLDDSTVILNESVKGKLPETLKMLITHNAKNVHIPWSAMAELIRAPQELQTLLNLNFYKSEEDLLNQLFK